MKTVEIDKKIASLKEEIEKLDLNRETHLLMRKYGMHVTEAMNFIEYDCPEYF